jgi:hypothetical protein
LQIYFSRVSINIAIHRLQAFQKYGDLLYEEGTVVRHLNGDPGSNAWDNIAIGTMSDNMFDIPKQIRIEELSMRLLFVTQSTITLKLNSGT